MKYGCCTNMLIREPGSVGEEYLSTLAELGYDYVELPLGDLTTILSPERKAELKKLLAATLPVYSCNNFFTNDIRLCGPDPTPAAQVADYYQRALYTAAEFGVQVTVFGSPWSKRCPDGFSREAAFQQLTEVCCALGDEAAKYGITVALEPNNTLETNMINTYGDVLDLARAASHPNIRGLQDYFHLKQEKDTVDSMIAGKEYLVHTHFARYEGRKFPKTHEEDPYYEIYFRTLKEIGYEGGVSMEGFLDKKEDFRQDAADTLAFFRSF